MRKNLYKMVHTCTLLNIPQQRRKFSSCVRVYFPSIDGVYYPSVRAAINLEGLSFRYIVQSKNTLAKPVDCQLPVRLGLNFSSKYVDNHPLRKVNHRNTDRFRRTKATSEEMIQAYAHVPRPFGTIIASEIFGSGIMMSEWVHGNLSSVRTASD